jgi:hypothetical protein
MHWAFMAPCLESKGNCRLDAGAPGSHNKSGIYMCFLNDSEAYAFLETVQDPVVRSLIKLVNCQLLQARLTGNTPTGSFDMLYLFKLLHRAFSSQEGLASAVKGEFGEEDVTKDEWVKGFFRLQGPPKNEAQRG